MPSFNPGTRVIAQLPNKTIWRIAKVAELDPNQKPQPGIVYVTFSGKSEKVKRNLKQVKLPPQQTEPSPAPAVDLTDQITPQQNPSNSLPSYSDPWDPNAPKPSPPPPIPSSSPEPQSERPSSPPARTAPLLPSSSPIQSVHSSSRDGLLSNSYPPHHANQTHAQVVRDPTYSRHDFPQRPGSRRPPSVEAAPYPHAPPHHQSFASEFPSSYAPAFHTVPSRQTSAAAHMRSHPLPNPPPPQPPPAPYGPLKTHQLPNGAGRSNTHPSFINSTTYPARPLPYPSTSQVPQRNGLTLRAQDRHPFRAVDKNLPIPRTAPSRGDFRREPRHPQSAVDDDVPIPRNISRTRLSSSSHDGFADHPVRSYPAPKRPRLDYRYDKIFNDQMPPPSGTEAAASKLSRRLAKREISRHSNHWDTGHKETFPELLPYQRIPTREDNGVIIAPSFSKLESHHKKLPTATSDNETNILEEVFTGLSLSSSDSFLESGIEHRRRDMKVPPLAVRSGTRKKNRPKKLRAISYCESQLHGSDCSPAVVAAKEEGFLNAHLDSGFPIPKVFGCSCPENGKQLLQQKDAIQCSRCSLWLHNECAGFEAGDLSRIQDDLREETKSFICFQCLDDQVSLEPIGKNSQHQFSQERAAWFSSIPRITKRMRGLGVTATDPWLNYIPPKERGRDKRHWLREPLAEDEKSARLDNLERLREGVANASVGTRERTVLDAILMKGTHTDGR